jgi:4-amino-4-deoxy-L-arabinose transferase-like glycosyltransferase
MALTPPNRRLLEWTAVAALLLVAGALRMAWPGITEFKADEARLLSLALEMRQGTLAVRGISSSTGFPNFPMSVWLYALPVLVWPHPYAATLFTGLLNTLAVGGGYWLARRYWGTGAALAATLLFAVSPWAVLFSRKIWAQNLLPLFVMVWAISAALALVEGRRWMLAVHILALAVAIQIHLAAVALLPATLVLLLVFWRRVEWRALLAGVGLAVLVAAPFLVYLAPRLGGMALLGGGGEAAPGATMGRDALRYSSMIITGSDIHSLAGPSQFQAYLDRLPPMAWVYALWLLLVVGGVVWLVGGLLRDRSTTQAQAGFVLLVWLVSPLLVFLWPWTPVYLHYFIALLPAPYLISGVFVGAILARAGAWGRGLTWAVLLVTAGLQVAALVSLLSLVGSVATPGGFGTPLVVTLAAADRARAEVAAGATEVLIAGSGSSPNVDSFPAEFDALLFDVPRRFVDSTAEALYPAAASVVVADARAEMSPWATTDLYRAAASRADAVPARIGEGELLVLTLPGGAAPADAEPLDAPALLANWVTVLGTEAITPPAGDDRWWQIHWRTGDNPDPATYHFFNHLLGADGTRLAQVDAPAFRPDQWRAGDRVISRFVMPWPPAGAAVRLGMYRYPELTAVPLLDVAGNPYADALEVPLNR